ncbi:saccharopine dehydrogenase-like oxidoreductase isoform X3 [Plodia interpunctella]|uniref:saccharopine dehydrogenase-like oxidoreductase isoform X3 n=1 Tax=Plodia interpunctella TaxID=58824 RepID=UPI002367BB10|nr:saccharopine dehydrogenase-like oxidoreductase isoform X3 [Plodia interpunctella]
MERLDFIILGATGFTGKYVAKHLAKLCEHPDYISLKWGVCGRSKEKLNGLKKELIKIGDRTSEILSLICDIPSGDLKAVTSQAKVVINCTGPNTILSEPIVKACIETSTDYVDISAELFQMLDIYEKYNKSAEQSNVLIIPACGFSSIPVASGLIYLEKYFKGAIRTVQCYTRLDIPLRAYIPWANNCLINSGTWESMIHVFHKLPEHAQLKNKLFPENAHNPVPQELKKMKCFRRLLIKHPRIFSAGYATHKGPSANNVRETKFTMTFIGKGQDENGKEKNITAKVSGADPGYETTSTFLIISALTTLSERSKMPKGGVVAAAAAFHDTNIVQTIQNFKCLQFEIVSS